MDLLYYALVGAFMAHELDAVKRHEWRVLPITSFLPEKKGEQFFIWLHIPILALLLWGSGVEAQSATRIGFSIFAIVHVGLHVLFKGHPKYEFNNVSSWALIILTGALGTAYIIAAYTI